MNIATHKVPDWIYVIEYDSQFWPRQDSSKVDKKKKFFKTWELIGFDENRISRSYFW